MALKDIKTKIEATKRMHTVTRAMEAVSAVKMRKTQEHERAGRPYARAALSILTRLSGSGDLSRHPLAEHRAVRKTALVLITSDKGLAGALNSNVIKAALKAVSGKTKDGVLVYAIGRKGQDFFRGRGYTIVTYQENSRDDVSLASMEELSQKLSSGFHTHNFDEVIAAYSNFRSTFEQEAVVRKLLPLSVKAMAELVRDIQPVKGKWSDEPMLEAPPAYSTDAGVEGDEQLLELLVPRLVAVSLYTMLSEAKASEHSARMVAMKSASDKSKEVARDLTRVYNKLRQAAITREVSEIVGGREALAT